MRAKKPEYESLKGDFMKVFRKLPTVERLMPVCPDDYLNKVLSWVEVKYCIDNRICAWITMLKKLKELKII